MSTFLLLILSSFCWWYIHPFLGWLILNRVNLHCAIDSLMTYCMKPWTHWLALLHKASSPLLISLSLFYSQSNHVQFSWGFSSGWGWEKGEDGSSTSTRERVLPLVSSLSPHGQANKQHCLFRSSEMGCCSTCFISLVIWTQTYPLCLSAQFVRMKEMMNPSVQQKHVSRGVKLGGKIGLSIPSPHAWRTHRKLGCIAVDLRRCPQRKSMCRVQTFVLQPCMSLPDGEETSQALTYNSFIEDWYKLYMTHQALWMNNVWLRLCWFYIKNLKSKDSWDTRLKVVYKLLHKKEKRNSSLFKMKAA